MVQTRSMATINQKTGNPSNALERQVQTLVATVEQLTQRNQELEQQLTQGNERHPEDQCNKWDNEEQNDSHLSMGDRQERECQVLKTQVLCIQHPNLYCWQTMIKTMYLSCFRSSLSWFLFVKLECNTKLFKKQFQYISIDRSLGSINRKSYLTFFNQFFQLSPKVF